MEELEEEETNNPEQINSAVKCNDDVKDELKRNASSIATAAGIFAGGCTKAKTFALKKHMISIIIMIRSCSLVVGDLPHRLSQVGPRLDIGTGVSRSRVEVEVHFLQERRHHFGIGIHGSPT